MIIREALPGEQPLVGELRVAAYQAIGLLPESSEYAATLKTFGFGTDGCVVLVAAAEAAGLLGTITLEPYGPDSELARNPAEADLRAFAVDARTQGQGVGRRLLRAVVGYAAGHGITTLRLCTQPAMAAAQHLYATAGFSRTPDRDFSPVPGLTLRAYELLLTPAAG